MGWRWELGDRPLGSAERDALAHGLDGLGADLSLLDVYETSVGCSGPWTRPLWLRALDGDRLAGATLVVLCRDSGRSFLGRSRLGTITRTVPPIWYWDRTGLGTDAVACPGLPAPGVDLDELVGAAVARLSARAPVGTVVDRCTATTAVAHLEVPFVGVCRPRLGAGTSTRASARVLSEHRNLRRKVRRFASRGGTVQRLHGPLPRSLRRPLLSGYGIERPVDPPFAELYPRLVQRQWNHRDDRLVHLVARIDDRPVGYQTFWHTGRTLVMLSGVLDRPTEGTNAHAYENLLLASLDLADELGCTGADLGPAINGAKTSLLGREPTSIRFVSRLAPLRAGLRHVIGRTRLAEGHLASVSDG